VCLRIHGEATLSLGLVPPYLREGEGQSSRTWKHGDGGRYAAAPGSVGPAAPQSATMSATAAVRFSRCDMRDARLRRSNAW
jgi:hypothetical protein